MNASVRKKLLSHVVEVLDHTVAPWLAQGDEPGSDAQVQAGSYHRSEVLVGGLDAAPEVGVIV